MSEKLVHLQPTICIQQTLPIMTSFQLQECFEVIALCVASIYLTICICIGFFKAPKDELYRPYRQSKRMLTAALASMAYKSYHVAYTYYRRLEQVQLWHSNS